MGSVIGMLLLVLVFAGLRLLVLLTNLLGVRLGSKLSAELLLLLLVALGGLLVFLAHLLGVGFSSAFGLVSHLYHLRAKYCIPKQGIHSLDIETFIA
ncbi:hypothetical protein C8P63_11719 [Melghirimyces profundicolus]|uniref:Uncharacterized protein n=1 Tax=Melghirimyces profundicolus TaxID=1242148 RepID=A0A2T6BQF7_9BACL|nr:hypothetical protein C8P63_11719 [Melghirimyces profundicolus]